MSEKEDFMEKILRDINEALAKNIKNAEKEDKETRKMQDFIVEKITVGMALEHKIPSINFVVRGIEHYVKMGTEISRNEVLTRLTTEITRLEKMKNPAEVLKTIMEKDEHEKEVLVLVKSRKKPTIISPTR